MLGEFELYEGKWQTLDYDSGAQVTPHLRFNEIDNPSNSKQIKLVLSQDAFKSLKAWEYIRTRYGKSITLSCCYREKEWNKLKGGVDNSLHLTAQAYDMQLGKVTDLEYAKWLRWVECACEKYGMQGELGRYSWGLHVGFATKLPYTYNGLVYEFVK